jgi:hypothetical protein
MFPLFQAFVLSDGTIVVAKFNESLLAAGSPTLDEELGKFLHYVSIL